MAVRIEVVLGEGSRPSKVPLLEYLRIIGAPIGKDKLV
jgi:hypothetical protein